MTPEHEEDQGGDLNGLYNQNQSSFVDELDVNKLDDSDVERMIIEGKSVHRETMRNKIFMSNEYGFIQLPAGDMERKEEGKEDRSTGFPTSTKQLSAKEIEKM